MSAAFGCDAFLHNSIVQQCSLKVEVPEKNEGEPSLEDDIAFELQVSDEGSPQASAPCRDHKGSEKVSLHLRLEKGSRGAANASSSVARASRLPEPYTVRIVMSV